ncbi:hypothetical protein LINPERPRIM_LOCUS13064, partial [Linum perenne]
LLQLLPSPQEPPPQSSHNPLPRLTDCAAGPRQNRRRNHHYSTGQQHYAPLPLPRSLSVASSITNIGSGEDLHELMRAASVRYYCHENEAERRRCTCSSCGRSGSKRGRLPDLRRRFRRV